MNKSQIAFMVRFIENELISVSDACDYEKFDMDIERVQIAKAMKETIRLIKKSEKKIKLKKK